MADEAATDDARVGDGGDGHVRPEGHLTDGADLEVRADGANEPLAGGHPQLRPGQVDDEDSAPAVAGATQDDDRASAEREALIERVEDERSLD